MENNQRYNNDYDEISLRELIEVLLKEKLLIIGITALVIILGAVYTLGILKPAYKSEAFLTVSLKESVSTPYGEYELPFTTLEEYVQVLKNPIVIQRTLKDYGDESLTREKLLNIISTEIIKGTNSFKVKLQNGSPQSAYNIANIHVNNYLNHLELLFRRAAAEKFYNDASTNKLSIEKALIRNEENMVKAVELLAKTPKAINLENALISKADYALIYSSKGNVDLSKISGDKIISQELNPSYLKVIENITNLDLEKNSLENSLLNLERNKIELEQELEAVNEYRENYSIVKFKPGVSDSMKNIVTLVGRPELESQKVSPRNALNLAIAGVLGLMIGVFVAFFKNYWQNNWQRSSKCSKCG